jgi:hypothetical protein
MSCKEMEVKPICTIRLPVHIDKCDIGLTKVFEMLSQQYHVILISEEIPYIKIEVVNNIFDAKYSLN